MSLYSRIRHALPSLLGVAALLTSGAVWADVSARFDGRTIEYAVGSKPGGGYDRTTRLIAPFLQKHLTGSSVYVANADRANGLVALNRLATSDGGKSTILMLNSGFFLNQIAGNPRLRADLAALPYIGKATSEARYLVMTPESGISTFEELLASERTLLFPADSVGNNSYVQAHLLRLVFGINLRVVTGFGGSESQAAMAKGEIDGDLISESNVARLLAAGSGVPILRFGAAQNPDLAHVPDAIGVARTPDQALVVRQFEILTALGRVTVAAPAMDQDDLAALQAAFMAAMNDPELQAEAERQGVYLDPLPGDEVARLVRDFIDTDPRFAELTVRAIAR